ncbi:MAG TPA: ArsR family transcriptional regulator [Vicinamibacterales bacterium]|nr:ArsR family transcriptional regulator [Vicinamibacterales bacterium]
MTVRRNLLDLLSREPRSVSSLARELGLTRKTVEDDLRHAIRSARAQGHDVEVTPARCKACGFVFADDKLTKPGRCPACKGTRVYEPMIRVVLLLVLVVAPALYALEGPQQETGRTRASPCTISQPVVRLPGLPEASGVAASRRSPGVLWAQNDSGKPVIHAINSDGTVAGAVVVEGAEVDDWEDVAVAACPQGTCVYIADIGDNDGSRERITVYRAPEPLPRDASTQPAEAFHGVYPDGPHDAESLFVAADSTVFVITKGDPAPVALYRFPNPLRGGTPMRLERVGQAVATARIDSKDRPTAADASSDGRWVAVRTTHWLEFHRAADLTSGQWRAVARADLTEVGERRGEGLALGANGTVFLVGEGGLGSSPGTFARLSCTLPR